MSFVSSVWKALLLDSDLLQTCADDHCDRFLQKGDTVLLRLCTNTATGTMMWSPWHVDHVQDNTRLCVDLACSFFGGLISGLGDLPLHNRKDLLKRIGQMCANREIFPAPTRDLPVIPKQRGRSKQNALAAAGSGKVPKKRSSSSTTRQNARNVRAKMDMDDDTLEKEDEKMEVDEVDGEKQEGAEEEEEDESRGRGAAGQHAYRTRSMSRSGMRSPPKDTEAPPYRRPSKPRASAGPNRATSSSSPGKPAPHDGDETNHVDKDDKTVDASVGAQKEADKDGGADTVAKAMAAFKALGLKAVAQKIAKKDGTDPSTRKPLTDLTNRSSGNGSSSSTSKSNKPTSGVKQGEGTAEGGRQVV